MQPKIVFLGTAGDNIVMGKQIRSSGGFIVIVDDNQFHIDPGPGALARAADYNINPRNNVGVVVTNSSLIRCNDANAVIDGMTLSGMDVKGVLVGNEESVNRCIKEEYKTMVEKSIVLRAGQRVGINEVEIIATHTKSKDSTAIGLKFLTTKFVLGYSSDTGFEKRLIEEFKGVDIMVFNVPNTTEKDEYSLNVDDVIRLVNDIKPKLTIVTGFGVKVINENPIEVAREIQKKTKIETIAAKDGLVINPVSYSVTLRQRTLNIFKQ